MTEADRLRLYKSNAESNRDAAEQRSKEAEDKIKRLETALLNLSNEDDEIMGIYSKLTSVYNKNDNTWKGQCFDTFVEDSETQLFDEGIMDYHNKLIKDVDNVIRVELKNQREIKLAADKDYETYDKQASDYDKDLNKELKKKKK